MKHQPKSINQPNYISEIKYRVLYSLLGLLWTTVISYKYGQTIIYILLPFGIYNLLSTDITDIFITYLNTATTMAFIVGSIILLVQSILFLRPGLYKIESTFLLKIISLSLIIFFILYSCIYPQIIQVSWNFFSSFSDNFIPIQLNLEPHLKIYMQHIQHLGLLLTFIGPLLIGIGILLEYSNTSALFRYRKIFYLTTIVITALITPPDPASQLVLSLLIVSLYESYLIARLIIKLYIKQISLGGNQN